MNDSEMTYLNGIEIVISHVIKNGYKLKRKNEGSFITYQNHNLGYPQSYLKIKIILIQNEAFVWFNLGCRTYFFNISTLSIFEKPIDYEQHIETDLKPN